MMYFSCIFFFPVTGFPVWASVILVGAVATFYTALVSRVECAGVHGLSQYLETGCPNGGFIDFCVSKVWYKVHTTNKINPIHLHILLFRPVTALCVL